jgi:hypothetical protein
MPQVLANISQPFATALSFCAWEPHTVPIIIFEMDRPRRAAAQKPEGHYAGTSATRKTSGTRKTPSTRKASPTRKVTKSGVTRKQRKGKNPSEGDEMDMNRPTPAAVETTPGDPPEPLDPAALALDFKRSYEGAIPPPVRPKRGKRFKQPASNPITNLNDVAKGWSLYDPDLDPQYVFPAIQAYVDTNIC